MDHKRWVVRGWSWNNNPDDERVSAYRNNNNNPDNRNNNIGLRVAVAPSTPLWSKRLQTRVLDFMESKSVFEGVPIRPPGLA